MNTIELTTHTHDWISFNKKYYFLLGGYLSPALVALVAAQVAISNNGHWFWITPLFFYLGIALFDLIVGKDSINPTMEKESELKNSSYYNRLLLGLVPSYWLVFIFTAYVVMNTALAWHQMIAAVIGIGILFGGVFTISHELGHRAKPILRWGARLSIALFGYCHFHIEHNRGHHVHVSTAEDPASSRMGENIYQFALREIPGTFKRGMALEKIRLARLGKGFWSVHNEVLQIATISLVLHSVIISFLGIAALPFSLICCMMGFFQLTLANYLEHYGLLRLKKNNGRYHHCEPKHSWNCNYQVSNMLTLQLQRHSDHHANPTREFQILRDVQHVPMLPAGYPMMMMISLIPPLWRKVMDQRLVDFVGNDAKAINMKPGKENKLINKYNLINVT
jgi:alkane 1-monooxygenase